MPRSFAPPHAEGDDPAGDRLARRNAVVLATANALAGANGTIVFAATAIVGHVMTGDVSYATLPLTIFIVGVMAGARPIAELAHRFGRQRVYVVANGMGGAAALVAAYAILQDEFALFCAAIFVAGLHQAAIQSFRFAAADTASASFRPKAIAWVLGGGVAAAVIGPQVVLWTADLMAPHLFVLSFAGQAALAFAATAAIAAFYIDPPAAQRLSESLRPLRVIFRQRGLLVVVGCTAFVQAAMNVVMLVSPLAMLDCGYSQASSSLGIQWHGIAMFAPSFVSGRLIQRFGKTVVCQAGLILILASAVVAVSGLSIAHFWISLILLGIGWNFAFVSATAMIADYHSPAERGRAQGTADLAIYATTALASLPAGFLLEALGWQGMSTVVLGSALVLGGLLHVYAAGARAPSRDVGTA